MIRLTKVSKKFSNGTLALADICCDPSRRIYLCGGSQRCGQIDLIQIA